MGLVRLYSNACVPPGGEGDPVGRASFKVSPGETGSF